MARSIFDSRSNHNSYYRSPSDHSANGIYYLLFIFILAIAILIFDNLKKKKDRMESKRRTTKKVLITGGCEGIGRELAIQFAKNLKCDIIIFDNRKEHVEDLLGQIERLGSTGHFYECDFLDKDSVMKSIAQTMAEFESIDILINATGKTLGKRFEDYCHEELAAVIEANLLCPTILIKEFLTLMKKRNYGHIVDVSTESEYLYSLDNFTYCGVKAGLIRFLRSLQTELKYTYPRIKITVTNPHFFHFRAAPKRSDKAEMVVYAEKIYYGIMTEKDEV